MALAYGLLGGINLPTQLDPLRPIRTLSTTYRELSRGDHGVAALKFPNPSIVYYTDHRVEFIDRPRLLRRMLSEEKEVFLYTKRSTLLGLPPGMELLSHHTVSLDYAE